MPDQRIRQTRTDGTSPSKEAKPRSASRTNWNDKAQVAEYQRQYRRLHIERLTAQRAIWYRANRDTLLANEQKAHAANPEIKRSRARAVYASDKERILANNRKWAAANRTAILAKKKEYRERHKEELAEAKKAWRAEHPALVYGQTVRSRARYPEKHRIYKANHYARVRGAEGHWTLEDIKALARAQKDLCAGCGEDIRDSFTIDHVIAVTKGGSNWPTNLQLLCNCCNSTKNNATPEVWTLRKAQINAKKVK